MKLDGVWRVTPITDELRRSAVDPAFDDGSWATTTVPSQWRTDPAFADSDGPLLYRRGFTAPVPEDGRRRWITFDGIFYQADVWLDGAYLGDPEGYFAPHSFDITALSRLDEAHMLAVEVACSPQNDPRAQTNITGVFQISSAMDQTWNPGGIWRDVYIHDTGPARIDRLRVLCRDANANRAHLLLTAHIDIDQARRVVVRTAIDGRTVTSSERPLASGTNDVSWSLDIGDPRLWWPHRLGPQDLSDVTVEIAIDGEVSDARTVRTGLREVAWNDWQCSVNGERLFLKAANLLPTKMEFAQATVAECRRDVELAVDLGLDALRVHGHIARSSTYDAADELGILLMQDFPLQWGYQRSVRGPATSQAREMVDVLGHHPSIVQWTAHNDPSGVAVGLVGDTTATKFRYAVAHQTPTWNRTVLDRWVKRAIESADPTRMVSRSSGVLPHLPMMDASDSHFFFGWYHGQLSDLASLARQAPQLLRFMSEFGAQSVPDDAGFMHDQLSTRRWPNLDWERLAVHHGLQRWVIDERLPPNEFGSYHEWQTATQLYQAQVLRYQIELLRTMKYRPAGGFAFYSLNDPSPMASFAIYDDQRRPKRAVDTVRSACQPVLAVALPMPMRAAPGDEVAMELVIVNDTHQAIPNATLVVSMSGNPTDPIGTRTWTFEGDLESDSVTRVGDASFIMGSSSAEVTLEITAESLTAPATNTYRVRPVP